MKSVNPINPRIVAVLYLSLASLALSASQPGMVFGWGIDQFSQTASPPGLSNVVAIAGGNDSSVALRSDGTVVAWGRYGTNVPPGLSNVLAIAGGGNHSLALKSNGTVVAWGDNYYGQTNVPPGLSNVLAIAGGGNHSLALKSNGTVVAWGYNPYGQTNVPLGLSNVLAIAGGGNHSLALRSNGTVVAWGYNYCGQTNVPPGLSNVVAIAAGFDHSLALKSNGTVVAWGGDSYYHQTNVPPGLSNVVAIAAGFDHSLALKSNGTVVAWGYNSYGQTNVPPGLSNVLAIAGGYFHSLAIVQLAIVSRPPTTLSLEPAASTKLSVSVVSVGPFACQWSFNGQNLTGATGSNLIISNFDVSSAGAYSVMVTNQYGCATATSILRLTNSPVLLVDGVDVGGGAVSRCESSLITMSSTFGPDAPIYFTLDSSEPDFTAQPYYWGFYLTNSATIRAIAYNSDYTEWAEAAPIEVQVLPVYPLSTTTLGGGTVSRSPAPYNAFNRYISNTVVTLTATPSNGWSFIGWTGDILDSATTTTVLMDRPRTVQAVFGFSLNLFTNGNGQILLNPPSGPYLLGSTVQVTALPTSGSYFFGWAGAATGNSNPLLFTMTNTAQITGLFGTLKSNEVSLTVLPTGNGSVTVNPAKKVYTNGDMVTLTAVPATCNVFAGWSGGASGSSNPLALTLSASTVVTANFVFGLPTTPPKIIRQPLSRTLGAGSDTTLSFQATGDGPFSYQWRYNGSPLTGATDPTLTLRHITPEQTGIYDVLVTGAAGTVTSAVASVALFGMEAAPSGAGSVPLLTLDGAPGTGYRLEYSEDMSQTNWSLLLPVIMQDRSIFYVDDAFTNHPRRFYRAVPQ